MKTSLELQVTPVPAEVSAPVRVLFTLPGLHRVNRGAEVAFESVAHGLGKTPGYQVTLIGSGEARDQTSYMFRHAGTVSRKWFRNWPHMPLLRHDCMYEELSFMPGLWRAYQPREFDITVTCSYPYTNWLLRARRSRSRTPLHVYVTQNGDWALRARRREYKYFDCDGLVCTNPEYYAAYRERWPSVLIPNGVDPDVFTPGEPERARFGIPPDVPVVLLVSALIPSKRVVEGIHAVARLPDFHLVVAGDGPLRQAVDAAGKNLLGARYHRLTLTRDEMPALYRSCDVLLHMSQGEPSAVTYIEALATGMPVVAHDSPVTRWTFDGCAFLVDTSLEDATVEALKVAYMTRAAEALVGARRQIAVNRFSWKSIAQAYAAFFGGLLAKRSAGGFAR